MQRPEIHELPASAAQRPVRSADLAAERQRLLNDALRGLLASNDPLAVVRDIFPRVAANLRLDVYFNYMADPGGDGLRLHSYGGVSERTARGVEHLALGESISGTVARTRVPMIIDDLQNSRDAEGELARGVGIRAYACLPLASGTRLLGTLSFGSRSRARFDDGEREFVEAIANYVALALERAAFIGDLRASERLSSAVLESSPDSVTILDARGRIEFMNANGRRLMDMDEDDSFVGRRGWEVWPAESQPRIRDAVRRALGGQSSRFQAECPTLKGACKWWDIIVASIAATDGQPPRVIAVSRDITASRAVETALRESVEQYRSVFDLSPSGILLVDRLDGSILDCNAQAARHLGYSRAELRRLRLPDVDAGPLEGERAPPEGNVTQTRFRTRAGELRDVLVETRAVTLRGREHGLSIWEDVTERKRVDRNLALLAELGAAFVPSHSLDRIAAIASERTALHFGATRVSFSEVSADGETVSVYAGRRAAGLLDDRDTHRLDDYVEPAALAALRRGEVVAIADVDTDARTRSRAERYRPWAIRSMLLAPYLSADRWRFLLVVVKSEPYVWRPDEIRLIEEVSSRVHVHLERARAEEALRAANDAFRNLVETSPFGVYAIDADFRLVQVSAGAQKVFENVHPLIGRDFAEVLRHIWGEPFASVAIAHFRRTLETGERYRAPRTIERREDTGETESYDWMIERVTLPDGRPGVVCHFYDLSERQKYEAALREADRRKDEFLAMLAHELRNPLAPIRTSARLLELIPFSDPRVGAQAGIIGRQVSHLARLVDDLLDVSRVTQGKITLERAAVDMGNVVAQAVDLARPFVESSRQRLRVEAIAETVQVTGDATRLVQVFGNLLGNAAKYTPPGGEIRVVLDATEGEAVVQVIDNGSGIPPELLPRVFDLFTQGERSIDRAQGGLGIGLALVRSLVEMHGGRVAAASEGPGKGARFTVRLPRVYRGAPAPGAERAGVGSSRARTVLIVDDNVDAADGLGLLLTLRGHEVTTVYGAREALEAVRGRAFDAALLDIGLPDIDGYALARALHEIAPALRLVALTGYGQEEDKTRSRAAGFSAHLVKPVELEEVEVALTPSPASS